MKIKVIILTVFASLCTLPAHGEGVMQGKMAENVCAAACGSTAVPDSAVQAAGTQILSSCGELERGSMDMAAVVNVSAAYLRAAPDYESPLETQELMGVAVRVTAKDRYWVRTVTGQPYTAWVNEMALVFMTEEEMTEYEAAPKYMVTAMHSAVWESPGRGARQLCDLVAGDLLRIGGPEKSVRGYVPVILPDGRRGWTQKAHVRRYDRLCETWAGLSDVQAGSLAAQKALEFAGIPYLWGGMSTKGVDCSGLVRLSYMLGAGIMLPRNASQQYAAGTDIPLFGGSVAGAVECVAEGSKADFSALRPGDLLFFGPLREDGTRAITHVGIYLGDGRMIHASQVVRINSLLPGDEDCYENAARLHKACRIAAPCRQNCEIVH